MLNNVLCFSAVGCLYPKVRRTHKLTSLRTTFFLIYNARAVVYEERILIPSFDERGGL